MSNSKAFMEPNSILTVSKYTGVPLTEFDDVYASNETA